MAGKRQHYIPQFLQYGFISDAGKKQVHVYKKSGYAFTVPTSKIGVQNNFYTANETEADTTITTDENLQYSRTVASLRYNDLSSVSSTQIAQLLSHLTIRSKAIRGEFEASSEYLLNKFWEVMKDRNWVIAAVRRQIENEPSIITKELKRIGIDSRILLDEKVIKEAVINSIDKAYPQMMVSLTNLYSQDIAKNKLKPQIKKSLIEAMNKSTAPPIRVETLADLDFCVMPYESDNLILGDSMVFYKIESGNPYKILPDKKDNIEQVYLPLASNSVLVGTKEGVKVQPPTDLKKIIAQCSFEFFISNHKSEQNSLIANSIGEFSSVISNNEIDKIVSEVLLGF